MNRTAPAPAVAIAPLLAGDSAIIHADINLSVNKRRMGSTAKPGSVLKALRLQKGLTLAEVSQRTGLPVSTISKVENDKMSLSFDKIQAISTGLGIDAGAIFHQAGDPLPQTTGGRRAVIRIGDGRAIDTHLTTYHHLASELLNKAFVPLICEIRARSLSAFSEMICHPGEEFTYVLEGSLEFHSQLYGPVTLSAGESLYFDSGMPHAYIALGKATCRVLTICSSTEAQLFDAVDRSRPDDPAQETVQHSKPRASVKPVQKKRAAEQGVIPKLQSRRGSKSGGSK